MDKRMYRGYGPGRDVSPYRQQRGPVCGDVVDRYKPDDDEGRFDVYEGKFDKFPLAMAYVPWQKFENLYDNEFEALAKGTLFKDLNKEWYGRGCTNYGC